MSRFDPFELAGADPELLAQWRRSREQSEDYGDIDSLNESVDRARASRDLDRVAIDLEWDDTSRSRTDDPLAPGYGAQPLPLDYNPEDKYILGGPEGGGEPGPQPDQDYESIAPPQTDQDRAFLGKIDRLRDNMFAGNGRHALRYAALTETNPKPGTPEHLELATLEATALANSQAVLDEELEQARSDMRFAYGGWTTEDRTLSQPLDPLFNVAAGSLGAMETGLVSAGLGARAARSFITYGAAQLGIGATKSAVSAMQRVLLATGDDDGISAHRVRQLERHKIVLGIVQNRLEEDRKFLGKAREERAEQSFYDAYSKRKELGLPMGENSLYPTYSPEWFIDNAMQAIPSIAIVAASKGAALPAVMGSILYAGGQAGEHKYQQAISEGATSSDAQKSAWMEFVTVGSVVGVLEYVGARAALGGVGGFSIGTGMAVHGNRTARGLAPAVGGAGRLMTGALTEGATEGAEVLLTQAIRQNLFGAEGNPELWREALESFVLGGAIGGGISLPSVYNNVTTISQIGDKLTQTEKELRRIGGQEFRADNEKYLTAKSRQELWNVEAEIDTMNRIGFYDELANQEQALEMQESISDLEDYLADAGEVPVASGKINESDRANIHRSIHDDTASEEVSPRARKEWNERAQEAANQEFAVHSRRAAMQQQRKIKGEDRRVQGETRTALPGEQRNQNAKSGFSRNERTADDVYTQRWEKYGSKVHDKPFNVTQKLQDLARDLGINLRMSRLPDTDAGKITETFFGDTLTLDTNHLQDMDAFMHGFGHSINARHVRSHASDGKAIWEGMQPEAIAELVELAGGVGLQENASIESEGFAEFVGYFTANPHMARELAPRTYEWFTDYLNQNSKVRKDVLNASRFAQQVATMSPSARLDAAVGNQSTASPLSPDVRRRTAARRVTDALSWSRSYFIDPGSNIRAIENRLVKMGFDPNSADGLSIKAAYFGLYNKDAAFIDSLLEGPMMGFKVDPETGKWVSERQTFTRNGETVEAPSLQDVLSDKMPDGTYSPMSMERVDKLMKYIYGVRAKEMMDRGIETEGNDRQKIEEALANEEPGFKEKLQAMVDLRHGMLQMLADAGAVDPAIAQQIIDSGDVAPVPFRRRTYDRRPKPDSGEMGLTIESLKGADMPIDVPIEALYDELRAGFRTMRSALFHQALVGNLQQSPDMMGLMKEVDPRDFATENEDDGSKTDREAYQDFEESLLRLESQAAGQTQGDSSTQLVPQLKDPYLAMYDATQGRYRVFRVEDRKLLMALEQMQPHQMDTAIRAARVAARASAVMMTSFNLDFVVRSLARDSIENVMKAKHQHPGVSLVNPIANMAIMAAESVGETKLGRAFGLPGESDVSKLANRLGGRYATIYGQFIQELSGFDSATARATGLKKYLKQAAGLATKPVRGTFHTVSRIGDIQERGARRAEGVAFLRNALKQQEIRKAAALLPEVDGLEESLSKFVNADGVLNIRGIRNFVVSHPSITPEAADAFVQKAQEIISGEAVKKQIAAGARGEAIDAETLLRMGNVMDEAGGGPFNRIGYQSDARVNHVLSSLLLFWNPALQSVDRVGRQLAGVRDEDLPGAGTTYLRLSAMAMMLLAYHDEHQDEGWYKERAAYLRMGAIPIRIGDVHAEVHLPREFGALATIMTAMRDAMNDTHPNAMREWAYNVVNQFAPPRSGPLIATGLNLGVNYDDFYGTTVNSPYDDRLRQHQTGSTTTQFAMLTAEGLAKVFGGESPFSPKQIDRAVEQVFGSTGKLPADLFDLATGAKTGWQNVPGIRAVLPRRQYPKSVPEMFERRDKLRSVQASDATGQYNMSMSERIEYQTGELLAPFFTGMREVLDERRGDPTLVANEVDRYLGGVARLYHKHEPAEGFEVPFARGYVGAPDDVAQLSREMLDSLSRAARAEPPRRRAGDSDFDHNRRHANHVARRIAALEILQDTGNIEEFNRENFLRAMEASESRLDATPPE